VFVPLLQVEIEVTIKIEEEIKAIVG